MKIGVVGNCMAAGMGMALRQLRNDATVFAFEAREVLRAGLLDHVAKQLDTCQLVFSHDLPLEYGPLCLTELKSRGLNAHRFPSGTFTGFHPDCVYLDIDGKRYSSPLGPYHSAIAVVAFSQGLSIKQSIDLYSEDTFQRLGYFEEFQKACKFLTSEFELCGITLNEDFSTWITNGSFMHTINHPKGTLVVKIAKLLASQHQLITRSTANVRDLAYDVLSSNVIWPVYPDLANALGIEGSYLFKRLGAPDLVNGNGVFYNLQEFVELSFAMYANYPTTISDASTIQRVRRSLLAAIA